MLLAEIIFLLFELAICCFTAYASESVCSLFLYKAESPETSYDVKIALLN